MSNWQYANDVPTSPWRSAMSVPRALSLQKIDNIWRLLQQPVKEMEMLRGKRVRLELKNLSGQADLSKLNEVTTDLFEVKAELEPSPSTVFQLKVQTRASEETVLQIDGPNGALILDRTHSGNA